MRLGTDSSKGISEEVSKALGMSLNQIDSYRSSGGIKNLPGKTIGYGGGVVTDILSSELKNYGRISFFYLIVNCFMNDQSKSLQKSV